MLTLVIDVCLNEGVGRMGARTSCSALAGMCKGEANRRRILCPDEPECQAD